MKRKRRPTTSSSPPKILPAATRLRTLLARTSFLGRLPTDGLKTLIAKGQVKKFAKGTRIYRRGDSGDSLMVVIDGRIKIGNTSVHGREIVHFYAGPGEFFGEVAALGGTNRAADTTASEDSEVFVVQMRDLLPVLKAHPDAMFEIVRTLCGKIRVAAAIIEDNTLDMYNRTARGLLRLARRHGQSAAGKLKISISQEELGKFLGMSRENANRQLSQLRTTNIIKIRGTEITIVDQDALVEIAGPPELIDW
jgi:CRP/FNR family transcriptional regulator, cyclic AMP receptor protein